MRLMKDELVNLHSGTISRWFSIQHHQREGGILHCLPISEVGVWARGATSLGLDLEPGLPKGLGEVVIHRAGDGDRVVRDRIWLLVVLPQATAEVLLDHRVNSCVS